MASFNNAPAGNNNSRQGHISHLNVTPSDYELMQRQQQEFLNIEEDLALFTDTQFFDWDLAGSASHGPAGFQGGPAAAAHQRQQQQQQQQTQQQPQGVFDLKDDDFLNNEYTLPSSYNLPNLAPQTHHSPAHQQPFSPVEMQTLGSPASLSSMTFSTSKGQRIQGTASALSGKGVNGSETPGTAMSSPMAGDDDAKVAAEEDKRRRNTAASARFRVKKKQREQALEKNAKEMTDRVTFLEQRVGQLEMENKLLKDLLTEKSGKEVDVAELRRKLEAKAEAAAGAASAAGVKPEAA